MRDVLVFTPVLRLEPETVRALMMLDWDGPLSFLLQRDNPTDDRKENHLHQYVRGRDYFLRGDYDAMLVIESDIIPPKDALKRLWGLDADVAYGLYQFRGSKVVNVFERYPGHPRNEGESLSIHPEKLAAALKAGKTPCTGGGLGCALIRRHVLEKIDFRIEPNAGYCDSYFNREVLRSGLTQMADMKLICGHKNEKGIILWPEL